MSVTISRHNQSKNSPRKVKRQRGHVMPRTPEIDLDGPGWLRSANILALFSMSHSTLYDRLKKGTFPQPDGRDGGRNYWRTETIRQLLNS